MRVWNCIDNHLGTYSISCLLDSRSENFRWGFTGVYGPHTNLEREDLWNELGAVRGIWEDQWVICGGFNVCRFESEKHNCIRRSRVMRGFSDVIRDLCLVDIPLEGACYS